MVANYPVAASASQALRVPERASNRTEAEAFARGRPVEFVCHWLKVGGWSRGRRQAAVETGCRDGYLQVYEDDEGKPVFAVSYWRLGPKVSTPRTRRRRHDPSQLELFSPGPDQRGYERPAPDNPAIILVEEEGDGAAFGQGPDRREPRSGDPAIRDES